jgi:hypothetical protein
MAIQSASIAEVNWGQNRSLLGDLCEVLGLSSAVLCCECWEQPQRDAEVFAENAEKE